MSEMTSEEIRVYLNRAPSKYAYWSSLLADINQRLRIKNDAYDFWFAMKMSRLDIKGRPSEAAKKTQVILTFPDEYKTKRKEISELEYVRDQTTVLVKAYEMQSRTLQTVGSLMRSEMELQQ